MSDVNVAHSIETATGFALDLPMDIALDSLLQAWSRVETMTRGFSAWVITSPWKGPIHLDVTYDD